MCTKIQVVTQFEHDLFSKYERRISTITQGEMLHVRLPVAFAARGSLACAGLNTRALQ